MTEAATIKLIHQVLDEREKRTEEKDFKEEMRQMKLRQDRITFEIKDSLRRTREQAAILNSLMTNPPPSF